MKLIALIPAKNEEQMIVACIKSLDNVADEVIVYDDHSTDSTAAIAERCGATVITGNYQTQSGWPEYEIRECLLAEARKRQATHFLALDADEAITPNFAKVAREQLATLNPGDTLSLRWITLWKDTEHERVDGVFNNLYKDFAFCDDQTSHHQYAFLGVGRTPHAPHGKRQILPHHLGGILHFQYVVWDKTQTKQAWYKCSELIKGERSARRINHTYAISMDGPHVVTKLLPKEWPISFSDKSNTAITSQWHYDKIVSFFDQYGIEFFEPLQIWHIKELHELFIRKTGREPKVKVFPQWVVFLSSLKNAFKRL